MNIKKRILLTGARAPAALDLARKFYFSGHEVYVAESVKNHLCRYSKTVKNSFLLPNPRYHEDAYISSLISLIKNYKIDLLLPTCEEVFYIAKHLEEINKWTQVFTDKIEKLQQLHNKFYFNQLIKNYSIYPPKTTLLNSMADYQSALNKGFIDYPHILKPVYSRFASQVKLIEKPTELELDISAEYPWIAQTYIEGELICTYSICDQGQVLSQVFYANQYSLEKNGAGIYFKPIVNQELSDWICKFVQDIKYHGQIAFDVIIDKNNKLWPIECNPRATSGIHLLSNHHINSFLFQQKFQISDTKNYSMLALAMVINVFKNTRSIKNFWTWLKNFTKARDVVFHRKDIFPAISQFLLIFHFLKMSFKNKIRITQAATHDIEWNGQL